MKQIWSETIEAGATQVRWWDAAYDRFRGAAETSTHGYSAKAEAWYDRKTGVLVLDLSSYKRTEGWDTYNEPIKDERILETHATRERAIRSVIKHTDEWVVKVALSIPLPDTRTDEQVEAEYLAAQTTESAF